MMNFNDIYLEYKEFIEGINKRIVQQMDSYQRRALNID